MENIRVAKDGNRILVSFEGNEEAAKDLIEYVQGKFLATIETAKTLKPAKKMPLPEPDEFGEPVEMEAEEECVYPPIPVMKRTIIKNFEDRQVPRAKYSKELREMTQTDLRALYRKIS